MWKPYTGPRVVDRGQNVGGGPRLWVSRQWANTSTGDRPEDRGRGGEECVDDPQEKWRRGNKCREQRVSLVSR